MAAVSPTGFKGKLPVQTKEEDLSFGNKKDKRVRWCQRTMSKPPKYLCQKFLAYKRSLNKPEHQTSELFDKNAEKNRYDYVFCFDSTRVVLKDRDHDKDYIHANWVSLPDGYKYICAQDPLEKTVEDFWHMVASENCSVIVMLGDFLDPGTTNPVSFKYFCWESKKPLCFGPYSVRYLKSKQPIASGIFVDVYELSWNGHKRKITHFWYIDWAESLAPDSDFVTSTIELLRLARTAAMDSPIVVHCSAGVGRTLTFVGIDYAVQKIKHDENYSLCDYVKEMSTIRYPTMISPIQFMFLNLAIIEYFVQTGVVKKTAHFEKTAMGYDIFFEKMILALNAAAARSTRKMVVEPKKD